MSRITQATFLSAAVATSGTFTVGYPTGYTPGHFKVGRKHRMVALQRLMEAPKDFTVSFGATVATITYLGATTIPAGAQVFVEFDTADMNEPDLTSRRGLTTSKIGQQRVLFESVVAFTLGSPLALSTTSIRAAAAIGAGGAVSGLLTAGLTMDVPRNVTTTSSGNDAATVYTVTGTDEYGNTLVENIAGGNVATVQGKKAFKTVTGISASAAGVGNISFGRGDTLGLPVHIPGAGNILREIIDGAAATAGTLANGVVVTQTATTGDIRGTYIPNSATDGSRTFEIVAYLADPTYIGGPQFAG
jgi:hypothetical protein